MDKSLEDSLRLEVATAAEEIRAGKPGWKIKTPNPKVLRQKLYQVIRLLIQETGDEIYMEISVVYSSFGENEVWIIPKKETKVGRPAKYKGTETGSD